MLKAQKSNYAYNFEAFHCETPQQLEAILNTNKHRAGFCFYVYPAYRGVFVVIATANLEVINARTQPQIVLGLKPLKEGEAKDLIKPCIYVKGAQLELKHSAIENFITWLYENNYEICRRVEQKKEAGE